MGVQGLWDLLAPVGRRVSVETLSGKKLAIDASIWMVQFMKAMRDEKGEMIRNAHLLGFFRRICKLLFLRTKPIFVFDGATPALKRRTVIARRRQRDNAQAKIRKTAEKLLLNHLKAMRLKDLAKGLENQRKDQKNDDAKGKKILSSMEDSKIEEQSDTDEEISNREKLDEMLAASLAAEEDKSLSNGLSTAALVPDGEEGDSEDNEEIIWPEVDGSVDPVVLASLPTALQLDVLRRKRSMVDNGKKNGVDKDEEQKGNATFKEFSSNQMGTLDKDTVVAKSYNQRKLDEMLAASIAAEESGIASTSGAKVSSDWEGFDETLAASIAAEESGSSAKIASSGAKIPSDLEVVDEDEDEEMILPAFCGNVDPAILAALPPSMQLDLLVQMRERLMAENRQKYQKVKKAPAKFSELQIEAYLKTVSFRREINQVQKAAAGKDIGGIQTSRIASEANKEFIFSSSFMGDKQLLTSAGVQRNGKQPSDSVDNIASMSKSSPATTFVQDESSRVFDEDVETYVDERGRIRVSRVRAMGMRMTRDLQRNLDLMKEVELGRMHPIKTTNACSEFGGNEIGSQKSSLSKEHDPEISHENNANSVKLSERNAPRILDTESPIQISFDVDGGSKMESDDDIFTSLVAGQLVKISSDSSSDTDWEDGIIDRNDGGPSKDVTPETNASLRESNNNDDSEVEWEEEFCNVHDNSKSPCESGKPASRGNLIEESDLQEAIRRSLEDFGLEKFSSTQAAHEEVAKTSEVTHKGVELLDREAKTDKQILLERDKNRQNKPCSEILATTKFDGLGPSDDSHVFSSSQRQMEFPEVHDTNNLGILTNKSSSHYLDSDAIQPTNIMNIVGNLENHSADSVEAKEIDMIVERSLDTSVDDVGLSTSSKICPGGVSFALKTASHDMNFDASVDDERNKMEIEKSLFVNEEKSSDTPVHAVELTNPSEPPEDIRMNTCIEPALEREKNPVHFNENESSVDKFANNENLQADFSENNLQEEILILDQERISLGHEQKKLERNAESVTSEMFEECQELLKIFGIPYIIAPMEAEAQCAYMELANLVDGVVTDDSDVFLFGGRSVYKNIFDDRKYVETYFMKDIEKELGLTREKLIRMALLLGSDYTEGISGIGIVNAIEVVNAFPEEEGLQIFREWIESPDPNILGKFDSQTSSGVRKKGAEAEGDHSNCANSNVEGMNSLGQKNCLARDQESSADHNQRMKQIFMNKHRNVSKNWHVPSSFPSDAVISAYISPQVDKSTDSFAWGRPDIKFLQRLCWEKFGWGVQKSDELLSPVLKEYNKKETQLRLEAFYTFNERFAKIRSSRIKKAVKGITGNQSSVLMDDAVKESSRSRKKKTIRPGESGADYTEKPSKRAKRGDHSSKTDSLEKSTRKQSRRTARERVSSELKNTESQQLSSSKGSHEHERGKGGGQIRGGGRGKRKVRLDFEQSDSSSVDVSGGDDNLEVCVEKSEKSGKLRRSMRTRKPAKYIVDDPEIDDLDKSLDHDSQKSDDEAKEHSGLARDEGVCKNIGMSLHCKEHKNEEGPLQEDLYLQTDGGFVNEEDGSGNAGVSQDNCPHEAGLSEEYHLKMGGGFCMDESETAANHDATCSPSSSAAGDTADAPYFSSVTVSEEGHFGNDSALDVKETLGNIKDLGRMNSTSLEYVNTVDIDDHSEAGSVSLPVIAESNNGLSSLSGMPFLKRKRRKN
ncbi:DNA repair protein UVH3 [Euphorbia peplus]|nr:DNA repair protein UVH3 [Euphorbia peplus]